MPYIGYSKSVNAAVAQNDGRLPASLLARRIRRWFPGATAADVRKALSPSEWHHTSCKYNRTDHYDLRDLRELAARRALRLAIAERKDAGKAYWPRIWSHLPIAEKVAFESWVVGAINADPTHARLEAQQSERVRGLRYIHLAMHG